MGEEGFKPVENTEQEQNLNGEQDQDQPGTAENHLEDAALSLFQQAQSGFFGFIDHSRLLFCRRETACAGLEVSSHSNTSIVSY